jgi:hypothetical protein
VLGDDNISTVSSSAPWFNQRSVASILLNIGSVRSSSTKGAILTPYEKLSNVTFLKRSPRFVDGMVVWAIEEKTLWKMLSYRRKTELSRQDHHSVILSQVLAEAWMYGPERFSFFRDLALRLAAQLDLRSPLLSLRNYEDYVESYRRGLLITWAPFDFTVEL